MAGLKIKTQIGENSLSVVNYIFIVVFTFLCVYPFYYVIIYSISDPAVAARGIYFYPPKFDVTTYVKIFRRNDLISSFIVSILRTSIGTVLSVVLSSMFAYLMTKKEMLFRKFIYRMVIITMYMSAGLIPWYLTMKAYGLKNNFLLYIIPGAINVFFIILVKTYLEQLPASMEESAAIDGAGFLTTFFAIMLPLSKPIVATIAVYCSVGQWNSWLDNFLLVSNKNLQTLQLILYNYLNSAQSIADSMKYSGKTDLSGIVITPASVRMTIIVITVFPIMMVYPFLQKYFAKGILIGAIKG